MLVFVEWCLLIDTRVWAGCVRYVEGLAPSQACVRCISDYDKAWFVTTWRRGAWSCTIYPLGCGSAIPKRESVGARASDVRGGPRGRRSVGSSSARYEVIPVMSCVGVDVGHPRGMNGG